MRMDSKAPQGPPPPYGMHAPPQADMHCTQPVTCVYPPQQTGPTVVTMTNPATVIISQGMGPDPQTMSCPSCRATVRTKVQYEPGTKTHLFALLLCLFGCWPCCCIPYCMDSCQNGNHSCPNCGAYLGTYMP